MAMRLTEIARRDMRSSASRVIFPSYRLLNYRSRSSGSSRKKKEGKNRSDLPERIEIQVAEVSDLAGEVKWLEDAIHAIMVRQAAPQWLPFLPGSSYWVPPSNNTAAAAVSMNLMDLIGKIVNPMTMEESLSLTTARGWPSYAYYIEGASPHSVETTSKLAQSDEEEG